MATWLTSLILPGADSFEVCRVKSHVESDWSVSTMTDPPPNESYPVNRSKCSQFTNNKVGCSPVGCSPADTSNDPPMTDEALLSTVSFPYHSFMAKYIKEYASTKGFCHCTSVNTTLKAALQLNYFLVMKAITLWNQIQVRIIDTLKGFFLVALANLKAVSRASNAVFALIIIGIPSRKVLCSATDHQIFPTTIDYFPSSQLWTIVSLLAWRTH